MTIGPFAAPTAALMTSESAKLTVAGVRHVVGRRREPAAGAARGPFRMNIPTTKMVLRIEPTGPFRTSSPPRAPFDKPRGTTSFVQGGGGCPRLCRARDEERHKRSSGPHAQRAVRPRLPGARRMVRRPDPPRRGEQLAWATSRTAEVWPRPTRAAAPAPARGSAAHGDQYVIASLPISTRCLLSGFRSAGFK